MSCCHEALFGEVLQGLVDLEFRILSLRFRILGFKSLAV